MKNGEIAKWNDEKGYGFIKPDSGKKEIFIHISAFSTRNRRPAIGDRICYESIIETSGKEKAKFASFLNRVETDFNTENHVNYRNCNSGYRQMRKVVGKFVLIVVVPLAIAYSCISKNDSHKNAPESKRQYAPHEIKTEEKAPFHCEGKRHCGQMNSKEEAQFYLQNCPTDGMDGDNDGNACEQQFGK